MVSPIGRSFDYKGMFAGFSTLSIAPIVDLFFHPDLQGVSPVTIILIEQFQYFGLPTTLTVFVVLFIITLLLKISLLLSFDMYCYQ